MMILMIRRLEIANGCYLSETTQIVQFNLQTSNHNINATKSLSGAKSPAISGEDAAAQPFCTNVASFRNTKEPALPFAGEVVATTTRCTRGATSTQLKSKLNNLPFTETEDFVKILLNG
jgi:hypothetical protein